MSNPKKNHSQRQNKRYDHKQDRAAIRQILGGGNARQPQHTSWSAPSEPIPVLDDSPQAHGKRRKRNCCPKNNGGPHVGTFKLYHGWRSWYVTVCKYCGKHKWGHGRGWEMAPVVVRKPFSVQILGHSSLHSRYATAEEAWNESERLNSEARELGIVTRYWALDENGQPLDKPATVES